MADTRPSATSSSVLPITPPVGIDLLARAPIKRARPQLSCTPCRQGKLKCSREHPVCDQCAKRSRHEACQYVPPPPRNKQAQNMRGRIRNLESLVVNLINQKQQETGEVPVPIASVEQPATKESDELSPETFGQLRISNQGNETYVGAAHWSAVLKEIEVVKNSIEDDEFEDQEEVWDDDAARSTVTFGVPKRITKTQLIQEMPPKEECDRLLPLWFNRCAILPLGLQPSTYNPIVRILFCSSFMLLPFKKNIISSGSILRQRPSCGLPSSTQLWLWASFSAQGTLA